LKIVRRDTDNFGIIYIKNKGRFNFFIEGLKWNYLDINQEMKINNELYPALTTIFSSCKNDFSFKNEKEKCVCNKLYDICKEEIIDNEFNYGIKNIKRIENNLKSRKGDNYDYLFGNDFRNYLWL